MMLFSIMYMILAPQYRIQLTYNHVLVKKWFQSNGHIYIRLTQCISDSLKWTTNCKNAKQTLCVKWLCSLEEAYAEQISSRCLGPLPAATNKPETNAWHILHVLFHFSRLLTISLCRWLSEKADTKSRQRWSCRACALKYGVSCRGFVTLHKCQRCCKIYLLMLHDFTMGR